MSAELQLNIPEVGKADRRLPLKSWELLVERLERRSHGTQEKGRLGSPRMYWLPGTYPQLIKAPDKV